MRVDNTGAFSVSPAWLHELAGEAADIHARLDGIRDLAADLSSAFGSSVVAVAFEHFVSGWRDGRRQIAREIDALSRMLDQAAQVYSDTDASLASAVPVGPS